MIQIKIHGNIGKKHSPESIEKMRLAHLGKKHSPEAIEKIGLASLGRKHTPEAREKTRQAHLGKKLSPEHIEKIRLAHLKENLSPETIEKNKLAHLKENLSPETIEKMRLAHLGKKHSPEAIEKIGLASLGRKKSPETREKSSKTKCDNRSIFWTLDQFEDNPYCPLFNDEIRKAVRTRDDFTCQHCGKKQSDLIGRHKHHAVHHVHYDKRNCFPDLITLCGSCNTKANKNRDEWEKMYMNKLNDRNLLLWTKCRNKQNYNDEETI